MYSHCLEIFRFCLVVEMVRGVLRLMTVVLHWGKPAELTAPVTAEGG